MFVQFLFCCIFRVWVQESSHGYPNVAEDVLAERDESVDKTKDTSGHSRVLTIDVPPQSEHMHDGIAAGITIAGTHINDMLCSLFEYFVTCYIP